MGLVGAGCAVAGVAEPVAVAWPDALLVMIAKAIMYCKIILAFIGCLCILGIEFSSLVREL